MRIVSGMRSESIPAFVVALVLTAVLLVLVPLLHLPTTLFVMLAVAGAFLLSALGASMLARSRVPPP